MNIPKYENSGIKLAKAKSCVVYWQSYTGCCGNIGNWGKFWGETGQIITIQNFIRTYVPNRHFNPVIASCFCLFFMHVGVASEC